MGPYVLGKSYLFRTVTNYLVGTVISVGKNEIELNPSAWVADTGRFMDALSSGKLNEVESVPDGYSILNRRAIVDAFNWSHEIPSKQV